MFHWRTSPNDSPSCSSEGGLVGGIISSTPSAASSICKIPSWLAMQTSQNQSSQASGPAAITASGSRSLMGNSPISSTVKPGDAVSATAASGAFGKAVVVMVITPSRRPALPRFRRSRRASASAGIVAHRGWWTGRSAASPGGQCRCPNRPLAAYHIPGR